MGRLTHLALRLSDTVYNVPGAIYRHMLVSCRHGAAWLGKPDRGLPAFLVETLNQQIQAGHPTYLFLIDPDPGNRVMYLTELQAVSLKAPPEKGLVPGFYREMKMLSRMKAWLKIGDLEGFRLDEQPGVEEANRRYAQFEEEALRRGPVSLPGYFELLQEQV
ncbi:MAG TPA: hypothetical protein VFY26_06270 [Anaerolineales bacterium]|nr:hypothetical protein [Anaerolineales bacterium]